MNTIKYLWDARFLLKASRLRLITYSHHIPTLFPHALPQAWCVYDIGQYSAIGSESVLLTLAGQAPSRCSEFSHAFA